MPPSTAAPKGMKAAATLKAHKGAVNACTFNRDGSYCMTGGDDRRLLLWNPHREDEDGQRAPIKEYSAHNQRVLDVTIAKDNASFASCGGDKAVFVWDVTSGRVIRRLLGHDQRVNAVRYNADCSVLVSASYDKTVRCWDMRSRNAAPIQVLSSCNDSASSVQVTDHEILVGSIDGSVRIFDIRSGKASTDILGPPVTHVAISHDQNCVLAASLDSTLRLLDKASGEVLVEYRGHENNAYKLACCFSRDDANVMCGSEDGSVHIWDLVEAKLLTQLRGHTGPVCSISCHPKGAALLTASYDGTAKLWLP